MSVVPLSVAGEAVAFVGFSDATGGSEDGDVLVERLWPDAAGAAGSGGSTISNARSALRQRDGDGCRRRRGPMFERQRQVIGVAAQFLVERLRPGIHCVWGRIELLRSTPLVLLREQRYRAVKACVGVRG